MWSDYITNDAVMDNSSNDEDLQLELFRRDRRRSHSYSGHVSPNTSPRRSNSPRSRSPLNRQESNTHGNSPDSQSSYRNREYNDDWKYSNNTIGYRRPMSNNQDYKNDRNQDEPRGRTKHISRAGGGKRALFIDHLEQLDDLYPAEAGSPSSINKLITSFSRSLRVMETLVPPEQLGRHILMFKLIKLLDKNTRDAWETFLGSSIEFPAFEDLESFLLTRTKALERADSSANKRKAVRDLTPPRSQQRSRTTSSREYSRAGSYDSTQNKSLKPSFKPNVAQHPCSFCKEIHFIVTCPAFRNLTEAERRKFVTAQPLCFNCLGLHAAKHCKSTKKCKTCGGNHHTMIHVNAGSRNRN